MICADTPIFHEVGGDAILYFNPDSPEEAANAVSQLADQALSEDLIARGYENAKRFTWEASAEAAATIINHLS
jgi:glycosyltransferase involved in cell wall biosynthesis